MPLQNPLPRDPSIFKESLVDGLMDFLLAPSSIVEDVKVAMLSPIDPHWSDASWCKILCTCFRPTSRRLSRCHTIGVQTGWPFPIQGSLSQAHLTSGSLPSRTVILSPLQKSSFKTSSREHFTTPIYNLHTRNSLVKRFAKSRRHLAARYKRITMDSCISADEINKFYLSRNGMFL